MTHDDSHSDDFQEFLRRMLGGGDLPEGMNIQGFDLSGLMGADGMQPDPAQLAAIMKQMQAAFGMGGDPWQSTLQQALHVANRDGQGITAGDRTSLSEVFALASLWLGEATNLGELSQPPVTMTRGEWVEKSLPVWREVAEPVSTSIAEALTEALGSHVPDEMQTVVNDAASLMRGLGASVFAMQFGRVLGELSLEVVSGGDVGIPVLPAGTAAVIPQNLGGFAEGLEIPDDQLQLYLATREMAYARLYRHARWLHLHVMSKITDFARGVEVDIEALDAVADRIDPTNLEELKSAMDEGALLPTLSDAQRAALEKLEHLIATIDGWVDVVTGTATARLPDAARIGEAARRRRAEGGPAEDALGALVGLRIRPRRLREAAAMWQAIGDAVGISARDALWDYPDLMPQPSDIDDPTQLIARLEARERGEEPQQDEMDEALTRLLQGDDFSGDSDSDSDSNGDAGEDADGDEPSSPETPV
ncbi:zinc-dependent metalloprotease [Microbacterium sp. YY-01]|uniref:zinc-dependent metalloprotease n=1 Tax=Microbacterium sp. YY-01 TaxID=3421634 RepID=UPI003D16A2EF